MPAPYPLQLEFHADRHITRWRPLVQWLLAIPHLMIAWALRSLRQVLTLISLFSVLFTKRIPTTDLRCHRHDLPLRVASHELRLLHARGLPSVRLRPQL